MLSVTSTPIRMKLCTVYVIYTVHLHMLYHQDCPRHILRSLDATTQLRYPHTPPQMTHTSQVQGSSSMRQGKGRGRGETGIKRERTVVDLSAEAEEASVIWLWTEPCLGSYPQMTQHTEGGVRVKWVMGCRLWLYWHSNLWSCVCLYMTCAMFTFDSILSLSLSS